MRAPSPSALALVAFAVAAASFSPASAANLREKCTSATDCAAIENASCKDGTCACADGYLPSYNGTLCHHRSEAYGAQCRDNEECKQILGTKGVCRDKMFSNDTTNRCLCMLGNHLNTKTHTCEKSLSLKDKCTGDVEGSCYLMADGNNQHVYCSNNGTCECEDGYEPDYEILKCNSAPPLQWLSLSCLLGLLAVAMAS